MLSSPIDQQEGLRRPRIYLAGPDVFLPDAVDAGKRKKGLCSKYGFEGVFPIDAEADLVGLSPREAALRIGRLNEEMIRSCSAIVANITPFRGPSADVGTAYEMGFGRAVGLVVSAYSNVSDPFTSRTLKSLAISAHRSKDNRVYDLDNMAIEEFGLADNLMLESCITASGGCLVVENTPLPNRYTDLQAFERCLAMLKSSELVRNQSRSARSA